MHLTRALLLNIKTLKADSVPTVLLASNTKFAADSTLCIQQAKGQVQPTGNFMQDTCRTIGDTKTVYLCYMT